MPLTVANYQLQIHKSQFAIHNSYPVPSRHQTVGLILIALFILIFTIVRYARVIPWRLR